MKLRIFRICIAFLLGLLSLTGIFLAVYNIILANNGTRQDESYLILLISLFIGAFFIGFETFFVIRSFKQGTIILHQLCIINKGNIKRKPTLIIALIVSAIGAGLVVFNSLIYVGVITLKQSPMTSEFNLYYSLMLLVNGLIVVFYYLFIVQYDIEIID